MNGIVVNVENHWLIMLTQTTNSDKKTIGSKTFMKGTFLDNKDGFHSDGKI